MTTKVEASVEVDLPLSTVYNQWTQFEDFPKFMDGVEEVQQLGDDRLHWKASIAGVKREWDAKITEQSPDERVAWTNVEGATNAGAVTFHRLDENKTKVMLQLDYEPEGILENVGDKLGFVKDRAEGDLENFKKFIEESGAETGAWRGKVDQGSGFTGDTGDSTSLTNDAGAGTGTGSTGLRYQS